MSEWSNDLSDWNNNVIQEFRSNGGKVGGRYQGASLLLLTTTGRKSGKAHTSPLAYQIEGGRYIVVASRMGSPAHPAWYLNLAAQPEVTVEVGNEHFKAIATTVDSAEREQLLEKWPMVKEHQANTTREIPFVALRRVS
ncbi:nitroreductase family deazaflavin-dependent oxidoreductase [Ktedonosporobacter rubrisoli]|uniref:Nitroreductase family deazaflavin-dependent oxidoreductase n=1 Tax=Ktedonosporobacter rubrisoli TaxID=2509675 RepID=A0A4P6JL52_KTERU|nr:nitroreductase family deazaflavin-dependent oxidoreductase [Ktedonosporobacter rubrisoli]QBD75740.1 nitroreductase family deazaflavin-dependent oxidoreductase [Ktedonosporobacter rubrisoli]